MKATTKTLKAASIDARIFKLNGAALLKQPRSLKSLCLSICFMVLTLSGFAQYSLVGNAVSQGGGCYQLTTDAPGKVGAIWNRSKITLDSNFEVEGTMNFGTNDGNGADGIAFVFQPICSGLGGAGGGIGFYGVSPSLGVEFDTWQNGVGEFNDPAADHIAMLKNGNLNHATSDNLYGPVTLSNLEDGNNHSFKIRWFAAAQTIEVTFDNVVYINHSLDVVHDIFNDNPFVYWGFTAATGWYSNNQSVCISNSDFSEQGSYVVTHASCPSYNNGAIDINVDGMVTPLSFLWNTNETTEDLTDLAAGTYSVVITDSNACESRLSIEVLEAPDTEAPFITCVSDTNISTVLDFYTVVGTEFDPVSFGDYCSPVNLTNDYNHDTTLAGAVFYPGSTTVTWSVTDTADNTTTCSFTVNVTTGCGAGTPSGVNTQTGNFTINTQSQLNAFYNSVAGANYGNKFTKIVGSLTLDGGSTNDPITELCNLNLISEITGSLVVKNFNQAGNPTNLNALSALSTLGCNLTVTSNPSLTAVVFASLSSIGCSVNIKDNGNLVLFNIPNLASIKGDQLNIKNNTKLQTLSLSSTASSFSFTGKGSSVDISNNGNTAIGNLTMNLKKITTIRGALVFNNNDNPGVSNFDNIFTGLTALQTAWGKLTITNNDYLGTCCIAASVTTSGSGKRHIISGNTGNCADSVTVFNNCGSFHKRAPKAVSNPISTFKPVISPNPNKGVFKIQLNSGLQETVSVTVIDLFGRVVCNQTFTELGDNAFEMNLPNLANGQYIVKIASADLVDISRVLINK